MQNKGTGHGDRYIGSLFRVDEPVPDDFYRKKESCNVLEESETVDGKSRLDILTLALSAP